MENKPLKFFEQNVDNQFSKIKLQIEEMKKNRISFEQFQADIARDRELSKKGNDRNTEEDIERESIRTKLSQYGVFLKNLSELRYAVGCLDNISEKKIDDLVSHENAHANKIESLGIDFVGYRIIPYVKNDGEKGEIFFAQRGEYPDSWTTEEQLKAIKEIAQAPEEYESNEPLSESDKKIINNE